ncbi:MAG: DUF2306 domain-containing protein [Rhodobacteraceae bacterium]|nr:DUF2306 domain-containing protein [Paracoccaceae bacterium]
MTLSPILEAPFIVQFHVLVALPALLIGPFALFRPRRDKLHWQLGSVWLICITALAVSGLMIESEIPILWHFGPIHLLSIFALRGVVEGLWRIRRGQITKHRQAMRELWFGAMGSAGLFTLLPGRMMNEMVFGAPSDTGWLIIGLGVIALALLAWQTRNQLPHP